jgi:hypothetical protein
MGLFIVADLGALSEAAAGLGCAGCAHPDQGRVASLGEAGAEEALGRFSSVIQLHGERLSEAATQAGHAMHGYMVGYREVGGR